MSKLLTKKHFLGVAASTFVSVFLVAGFVFAALTFSANIQVGGGTPTVTLNGDDVYVTGTFEVDGAARFDGAINASSTILGNADWQILTPGDLIVGNGTPTVTQNGEDAYIEGTFEVDGAARFDGAINASSTLVGNGDWTILTPGDLIVGSGTPTVTQNGEDAYVTGTFEVDGAARFDGAITASSTITTNADLTVWTPGDLIVGNGTPTVTQNGEDAYIEGTFEVDGAARFDGAINASSTFITSSSVTIGSSGTAMTRVISASTSAIDLGTAATSTPCVVSTAAVTNSAVNDTVIVTPGQDDAAWDNGTLTGFVETAGTVKITFCGANGYSVNPTNGTYRITIFQF